MGTRRRNDVDATSLRRIDVLTTSCACWEFGPPWPPKNSKPWPPQYSKPSYAHDHHLFTWPVNMWARGYFLYFEGCQSWETPLGTCLVLAHKIGALLIGLNIMYYSSWAPGPRETDNNHISLNNQIPFTQIRIFYVSEELLDTVWKRCDVNGGVPPTCKNVGISPILVWGKRYRTCTWRGVFWVLIQNQIKFIYVRFANRRTQCIYA